MTALAFVEPATLIEACDLLAADPWGTKAISGGTAVTLMMKQGLIAPASLIGLSRIPEMHGITHTDDSVRIGAATTLTDLAKSPLIQARMPSVANACSLVGNPRIRNVATIGGNLAEADYASDPPAALASLGAQCHIQGTDATRVVGVVDLITGFYETVLAPGELISHIEVPTPQYGLRTAVYLKYRSRSSEDRACVGVAARADFLDGYVSDLDVVVASVASTLQRVAEALQPAIGHPLDSHMTRQVAGSYAQSIEPMEDARGSAWYREKMIEVFVRRALDDLDKQEKNIRGDNRG